MEKTLRDEIAMVAMGAIFQALPGDVYQSGADMEQDARKCYQWADAMLEASRSTESPTGT